MTGSSAGRASGKATKQLALDYFAGQLVGIKNDIKAGRADPMRPLADFITAFHALPEDRVAKLPGFVSLFSTLCDILDYKIQAFKAMVFEVGKDKLARFYEDPGGLDAVTGLVRWREAVEFTTVSQPFLTDVLACLGRERRPIPACEVIDDAGSIQASFDLPVDARNFFQEKAAITDCLEDFSRLAGRAIAPLADVLDHLETELGLDRIKAFIHVLHMIQDGDLVLESHDDDGEAGKLAAGTMVRLWRDGR
ncbi:MAG: hypothetical protein JW839_20260 [Candidatus Lokiarchaeota archaeon]|nr:hypothetical protein [Candidatus Lokiarchaeota archaeon]